MPDAGGPPITETKMDRPQPRRWLSPLLRRILLLNALPPALLAATLLYLDQYQNGLLAAEVEGLRTQARIYSGAIAEAATRTQNDRPVLVPEISRPLLRRLVEPSPNTQARLFDTTGLLVADSRVREAAGGAIVSEPLPPPEPRGILAGSVVRLYDQLLRILPTGSGSVVQVDVNPDAPSFDWQPEFGQVPGQGGPDRREELRLALEGGVRPYIRRTSEGRLLVSVAEPAQRGNTSVGIVLLTREAREVDQRLLEVRISVLSLFGLALLLTVLLSLYLARTGPACTTCTICPSNYAPNCGPPPSHAQKSFGATTGVSPTMARRCARSATRTCTSASC